MSDKKQLCDKCASEPISFEDFTSHYKYVKLKRQVEDLKLYVRIAIETADKINKEYPANFTVNGMADAYRMIQTKLNEI